MNQIETAHRQKSVELEKIDIRVRGGLLKLKLFAYPVKKQTYLGRLAFVVYYEYETCHRNHTNFEKRSGSLDRFWIDKNHNLNDLSKTGELALALRSPSYRDIRSEIIQMAIFDSVKQKPLKSSVDNIKWFNEHRGDFSKRQIGSNDFVRDKKREVVTIEAKKFEATEFTNLEVIEIKNYHQDQEVVPVVIASSPVKRKLVSKMLVTKPLSAKISPGLRKFFNKRVA